MEVNMFLGDVQTICDKDGKHMYLTQAFGYVDKTGKTWCAEKGTRIDGASIPRAFWRVIGSPYTGKYRRASVLHDAYYITKHRPKKDVDNMFLEVMLADGCNPKIAKAMYWAVKYFNRKKF